MGWSSRSRNGNEYLLLTSDWAERLGRKEPTPSYQFLTGKLAEDLGGMPADYVQLALALVSLVHGTAILVLGEGVQPHIAKQFKDACLEACQALIECGGKRVGGSRPREVRKI